METIKKKDGFTTEKLFVLPQTIVEDLPKHSLMRSLYMTDIGHFPNALFHYRERPEGCSSHIVIYCAKGRGWYSIDCQKRTSISQGSVIIIPAHTSHIYASDENDPWSIYWLHLKGANASDYLGDLLIEQVITVSMEKTKRIERLFQECFDILEKGYSLNNLIYVSQVLGHLLSFIFIYQGQQIIPSDSKALTMDQALQVMIDRLDTSLTLQLLADQVNLSKSHLIHVFKKHTGYSPIEYYLRLKIQRACQYLDLTDLTQKEICGMLGITDPYYFSRLFSKIMGLSPSKYRTMKKG